MHLLDEPALKYVISPIAITAIFLILIWRLNHSNNFVFNISIIKWSAGVVLVCGIFGAFAELSGIEDLVLIATIAAQALPLTVGIFQHTDSVMYNDRTELNLKIRQLESRLLQLESKEE